jgi:HK97 family phage major capsid protein
MENFKEQLDAATKGMAEKLSQLDAQVKSMSEKNVKAEDVLKLGEQISAIKDNLIIDGKNSSEYVKALQNQVNELEKKHTDLKNERGVKDITTAQSIKAALTPEKREYVKQGGKVLMEVKAAADILTTDSSAGAGIVAIASMREPGIGTAPWRSNPLYTIVPKRYIGDKVNNISWREETARTDSAAVKAEAAQLDKTHGTFVSYKEDFQKIGHLASVSSEEFEDDDAMNGWVNDVLINGLLRKLEAQIKAGSGTSELNGLQTVAKAFAKPSGVTGWSTPDEWQALRTAMLQVQLGNTADTNKQGFFANYAVVNPTTIFNIETLLNGENMLKYPGFGMNGINRIGQMTCLSSQDFTGNDGIVGDFSKTQLYVKRNLSLEVSKDFYFDTDMIAVKATMRAALVTKLVDRYAFVYIDFDTALPALAIS